HDISKSGAFLMEQELFQQGIRALLSGEKEERDLSWLDWSLLRDFSADGKLILINEKGEGGGGGEGSIYLRKTDGSPSVERVEGRADWRSPDGRWIGGRCEEAQGRLILMLSGAGDMKGGTPEKLNCLGGAWLDQEGKTLGLYCSEPRHAPRLYSMDVTTQK